MSKDIVLVIDYHDQPLECRWYNEASGAERTFRRDTTAAEIRGLLQEARAVAQPQGGQVVWVMESTTGWARVEALVRGPARFLCVNVLQLPLPPKARRRKTDRLDPARLLREYRCGHLPLAYQPAPALRRLRRLVDAYQSLVRRRTQVSNQVNRYLAHETWAPRRALTSQRGRRELADLARRQRGSDRQFLALKQAELEALEPLRRALERRLVRVAGHWAAARRLDAIYGIGPVGAVAIAARSGDIHRFAEAEQLIGYARLAPGVHQSDQTRRGGRLGGGGTDGLLRFYLLEAATKAATLPRYRGTYEAAPRRRGTNVARLVVARRLVRSVDVLLRQGRTFAAAA